METSSVFKPTSPEKRIVQIDILRGFALYGVLLVNVFGYNSSFFDFNGFYKAFEDNLNSTLYNLVVNYAADKFIFIFSFLFGTGFSIMYTKYHTDEKHFFRLYLRRLLVLMLFGIFHILFFWAGDILLSYSLAGLILLFTRRLRPSLLLILSIFSYFFPILYLALENIYHFLPDALSPVSNIKMPEVISIYSFGSMKEIFLLRLHEYWAFRNINFLYYAPKVLSLFIAGSLFHKYGFLNRINRSLRKYFFTGLIMLLAGITLNITTDKLVITLAGSWENPYSTAIYMGIYEMANIFLGFAYSLLILTLSRIDLTRKLLMPFRYPGRAALSNYLFQSVIFTTIMYSYGFGLFGAFQPWQLVVIATTIYSIQVIISAIWLQRFKFGPLEYLWRKLTYKML